MIIDDHLNEIRKLYQNDTKWNKEREHYWFELGRQNWERNMDMIGHSLVMLRREKSDAYPEGCWCDACSNNPNVTDHTTACKVAQHTLNALGYEPKDPIERDRVESGRQVDP